MSTSAAARLHKKWPTDYFASYSLGLLIVFFMVLWTIPAPAQMTGLQQTKTTPDKATVTLPENLTPQTIRELVSKLSDQEVRQLLLERLDVVAESRNSQTQTSGGGNVLLFFESSALGVYEAVKDAVVRVPLLITGLQTSFSTFFETRGTSGVLKFFGTILVALIGGAVAGLLVMRISSRWRKKIQATESPEGLKETLLVLGMRFLLDIGGLLAFMFVTRQIATGLSSEADGPLMRSFMISLIVIPLIVASFSRFLLAPNRPDLRLLHVDDWSAKYLHRSQIGIALLAGFSIFIVNFQLANGVSMGETRLGFWLNLWIFIWLGIVGYRARFGLTKMMLGPSDDTTKLEERVAYLYPAFAIAMVALTWIVVEILVSLERFDLLQGGRHFITLGVILAAPALNTMVRALVRHLAPPMRGEGVVAEQAYASTKNSYTRIGRVIVFAAVVLFIAGQWNLDLTNMASAGVGARFAGRLVEVSIILAIGYLIWEVVTLWLNMKLADEQTALGFDLHADEPGGGEGGGVGGSRLSTVLPLLRVALQVAIASMTILIALGNIGIDITPLLAGAGIVGLAIGFGAQTLVRDIVSGLFFLVDDAFRVGEYLVIGDTVGTVEKISIRSIQLRHHQGPVHTVPYGEIPKVTNNSRDWVIIKLKFTVPFDTDVNKIKKIFKKIGAEIMETEFAEDIIQTFKSQGVYEVDDVGIVIRGKFMTKPGKQWLIRKDIYTRVKREFEANGIEFARREVHVRVADGEEATNLSEHQKETVAAAAAETAKPIDPPPNKQNQ